jgi:hypothetical protein
MAIKRRQFLWVWELSDLAAVRMYVSYIQQSVSSLLIIIIIIILIINLFNFQINLSETRMCLQNIAKLGRTNYIVFIGDSRIRQLYSAFLKIVCRNEEKVDNFTFLAHHDLFYKGEYLRLDVQFLWRPMVNNNMTQVFSEWEKLEVSQRPNIVVIGSGSHQIESSKGSLEGLKDYRENLTLLLQNMNKISDTTRILWTLQDPVFPEILHPSRREATNERIDLYNKVAVDILKYSTTNNVHIWSSARLVAQGYNSDSYNESGDGLHLGPRVINCDNQMLLNMYCNERMNFKDGSCCRDPETITTIQIVTFVLFFVFIVITIVLLFYRKYSSKHYRWYLLVNEDTDESSSDQQVLVNEAKDVNEYYELIKSLAKLGLIMSYFFLCDRTNFFMKENKHYSQLNFFLPIAFMFALGLFFTEESSQGIVLHRDQTDELKGWMQIVILGTFST